MKHVFLLLLIACSAWLLWPPPQPRAEESQPQRSDATYVIRMFPGIYMPGTQPQDVGKPLEAMTRVVAQFEKLFPDTRVEFVNVPSGEREWLVTQLSAGQAPDILSVNVEDVWQDVQKGWYLALDPWLEKPNPFVEPGRPGSGQWWDVFKYQSITRGKAAPDGKMYCITLDMVETGIFYNKELFRRYGLHEPENWSQFSAIQQTLKDRGHIPLMVLMPFISDWAVDLLFDQFYYSLALLIDLQKDPIRAAYLTNYLDWDEIAFLHTKGFFTADDPRWVELWRVLKEWRRYFSKNLARSGSDAIRNFMTQKAAMLWASSDLVNLLVRDPQMSFEWGVFYLPKIDRATSQFASNVDMCVIGGAATQYSVTNSAFADTKDPANSIRLQRCIAFLHYLTTPAAADSVVNEVSCFLPNIVGVEPHKELLPFDAFLRRRYTSTKWSYTFDLQFSDTMDRMLELYLNDGIDRRQFLRWMQRNLDNSIDTINMRKQIDYSELSRIWAARKDLRTSMPGLPHDAR